MVSFIMASELKYYIVESIRHYPKNHLVLFKLVSMEDNPDIHMRVRYMKVITSEDNIYMIGNVECMDKSIMISGVAQKELEKFGKIMTQKLYNFYKEISHDKENILQSSNNEAVDSV